MLEKLLWITRLIEVYSGLLPDRQAQMCASYYMDNLSLSEIAENLGVSRQAVHDSIERALEALERAEAALKVISKEDRLAAICEKLRVEAEKVREAIGEGRCSDMEALIDELSEEVQFGGK